MSEANLHLAFVPLTVILPLREAVIIAGTNRATPYFPGDDAVDTRHVGVFDGDLCIGCATLLRSTWEAHPAWQLRGMAVASDRQRQGVGRALLAFLDRELPCIAPTVGVWCNAREKAVPFYRKAGFQVVSERFHIEHVGPHFRLFKPWMNKIILP